MEGVSGCFFGPRLSLLLSSSSFSIEAGRALHHASLSAFSFLLSLPGPASLSLVLSLVCLSLSLSLSLLHALNMNDSSF